MLLPITNILPSSLAVALVSRGVSPDDARATVAEVERKLAEANEEVGRFPAAVREAAEVPAAVLGGSPSGKDMFGGPSLDQPAVPFKGLRAEVVVVKSTRYVHLDEHVPTLGGWIQSSRVGDDEVQYHLVVPHYEVMVHLYFNSVATLHQS